MCTITFAPNDIPVLFVTIPSPFPHTTEAEELENGSSRHNDNDQSQNIVSDIRRGVKGTSIQSSAHPFSSEISLSRLEGENNTQAEDLEIFMWKGTAKSSDAAD